MKSIVLTTLVAAGIAAAASAPVQAGTVGDAYDKWTIYSDTTIACIEADAMKLTPGQHAYLEAILDDELSNERSTKSRAGLALNDVVKVHTFIWSAGPNCVLKS
jgi:hypothetical protein